MRVFSKFRSEPPQVSFSSPTSPPPLPLVFSPLNPHMASPHSETCTQNNQRKKQSICTRVQKPPPPCSRTRHRRAACPESRPRLRGAQQGPRHGPWHARTSAAFLPWCAWTAWTRAPMLQGPLRRPGLPGRAGPGRACIEACIRDPPIWRAAVFESVSLCLCAPPSAAAVVAVAVLRHALLACPAVLARAGQGLQAIVPAPRRVTPLPARCDSDDGLVRSNSLAEIHNPKDNRRLFFPLDFWINLA